MAEPQDCPYEILQSAVAPFHMQLQTFPSCSIVEFFLLQCVPLIYIHSHASG